jgi:hypothetical protein
MRRDDDGAMSDVTPEGFNVRTRVHEYGGGSVLVDGSRTFFANFSDQRLYRQDEDGEPRAITPEITSELWWEDIELVDGPGVLPLAPA